ncbi:hypothetical protein [Xenorhabdus thailandensis]|uniref:hypothetical protein n=1 Tax=Xenorhabdus thailandensis TaxID=3136255 RepID=UPI0030F3F426
MNIFSNESQSETIEKTARKKVLQTPLSNNKTHSRVSLCLSFFVGHFTPILPSFYPKQIWSIKKPTLTGWFF